MVFLLIFMQIGSLPKLLLLQLLPAETVKQSRKTAVVGFSL
jgi:hypothetical protein